MAFTRKVPYGLTALKTWVTESISATKRSIQDWCNSTFSLIGHTHQVSDIIGLAGTPDYDIMSTGYTELMHIYKTPADGWIFASAESGGGAHLAFRAIKDFKASIQTYDSTTEYLQGDVVVYNDVPYQARGTSNGKIPSDTPGSWAVMNDDFPIYVVPITSHTAGSDSGFGTRILQCKAGTTCFVGGAYDHDRVFTMYASNATIRISFISADGIKRELIDTGYTIADNLHRYDLINNKLLGI